MIINNSQWNEYFSDNKTHPNIFVNTDMRAGECSKNISERCNNIFYVNWMKIENFVAQKIISARDSRIRYLFVNDAVYLKEELGIEDTSDVLDKSIMTQNIRLYYSKKFDFSYRIIDTVYTDASDEKRLYISVFLGDNFYNDDNEMLKLIYDLAEMFLDYELRCIGIPYNRDELNNIIVLPDKILPSDAYFIMVYYSCIFDSIISITNNNLVDIKRLDELERPSISIIPLDVLKDIWDFCLHSDGNEFSMSEYTNVVGKIYNALK